MRAAMILTNARTLVCRSALVAVGVCPFSFFSFRPTRDDPPGEEIGDERAERQDPDEHECFNDAKAPHDDGASHSLNRASNLDSTAPSEGRQAAR